MVICIIGGSGSGKDTQGTKLSRKLNIPHISMGGILRGEEKLGNPLAIEAQKIANQGKWVPGDIIAQLLEDYLRKNAQSGVILNGFPRSIDQANYFPDLLTRVGLKLSSVIHLHVPDEVLYDRMQKQVEEGHDRADTTHEVMQQRLKSYKETIEPILQLYRQQGLLVDIDGTPNVDEVEKSIEAALTQRGVAF